MQNKTSRFMALCGIAVIAIISLFPPSRQYLVGRGQKDTPTSHSALAAPRRFLFNYYSENPQHPLPNEVDLGRLLAECFFVASVTSLLVLVTWTSVPTPRERVS